MTEEFSLTKRAARIAGGWFLLLGVFGIFAYQYVPGLVSVSGNAAATASSVIASQTTVRFGGRTAYVGMATGILGVISVVGSIMGGALASTLILTSLLTAVWVLLVGLRIGKMRGLNRGVD